jgi:predicted ABC-type ATPase
MHWRARLWQRWRRPGFRVEIVFLSLPDADRALAQIAPRVAQGGHDVPEAIARRRFAAGQENFHGRYKALVDRWFFYDNSISPSELLEAGSQT